MLSGRVEVKKAGRVEVTSEKTGRVEEPWQEKEEVIEKKGKEDYLKALKK